MSSPAQTPRDAAPRSPMSRAGRAFRRPRCRSRSTTGPASRPGRASASLRRRVSSGWRPSASARALTEARTRAIGLVLARDAAQLEGDSFFVRFLSGIERALTAADYALLLQLVPGDASAALPAYERLAAAGRVDGFLLTDVEAGDPRFALLAAAGVPVVLAGGRPATARSHGWRRATTRGWRRRSSTSSELGHERIGVPQRARRSSSTCGCARRAGARRWPRPGCRRARSARGLRSARGGASRCCGGADRGRLRERRPGAGGRSSRRGRSALDVPGRRLGDRLRRLAAGGARVARADVGPGRLRGVRRGRDAALLARDRRRAARRSTRRRCRSWWCAPRRRGRAG